MNELKEFKWQALEFNKTEKQKSWFIIPGIITIVLGIFALMNNNILFLILIVLGFFIFYIYANKDPKEINLKINEKGIQIQEKIYDFDEISSFWVFYNPPEQKELSFRGKKAFIPYIKIPLDDQDPNELRKYLLKFLPEKKHKESIIDIWMTRIGF
ncbi:hypothetical protein KKA23_02970 [Patescibacteria group bacterium]|nr:hypothetical protein [Patescibacteria group bacterium]MBU3922803.1 hypothetical protein [Patescibacteria group bacterium]